MAFSIKINRKKLEAISEVAQSLKQNVIDRQTARDVGVGVTDKMKSLIEKGISPIKGNGRFPGYKNPDKYPGDRKPKRPVNLWLSGDFISSLDAKEFPAKHGYVTEIFYKGDQDKKESGHREGVNGQPKRPTIPQGDEQFVVAIQRIITTIFKERIAFLLNKIRK